MPTTYTLADAIDDRTLAEDSMKHQCRLDHFRTWKHYQNYVCLHSQDFTFRIRLSGLNNCGWTHYGTSRARSGSSASLLEANSYPLYATPRGPHKQEFFWLWAYTIRVKLVEQVRAGKPHRLLVLLVVNPWLHRPSNQTNNTLSRIGCLSSLLDICPCPGSVIKRLWSPDHFLVQIRWFHVGYQNAGLQGVYPTYGLGESGASRACWW